jgi:hypothetical protein
MEVTFEYLDTKKQSNLFFAHVKKKKLFFSSNFIDSYYE